MQDLELPPPPTTRSRPALLIRKRTRDDFQEDIPVSAASSDPALFSGDEGAVGAEDYSIKKKKKKMYTGSWWNHRMKANSNDRAREFKRNYDSGIFMGSEGSEPPSSDSLDSLEEELMHDMRQKAFDQPGVSQVPAVRREPIRRSLSLPFKASTSEVPHEHDQVMRVVQRCLDRGKESVDLSSMSLTSLPPQIRLLGTLTKDTNLVPGMLDHGEDFEAQVRVFLASNLLRRVPREILDLTNLRELSVRQNKLTHLPPGIRNLVNLEILNIAGNKLTYLPFEIVELVRWNHLRTILDSNNPWPTNPDAKDLAPGLKWLVPWGGMAVSRWQVQRPVTTYQTEGQHQHCVPSLCEMTLRSLSRLNPDGDLREYMPDDTPPSVLSALEALHESQLDGGYECSSCGRTIVQAPYQEVEWWYIGSGPRTLERGLFGISGVSKPDAYGPGEALPVKRMFCRRGCEGRRNLWCDEPQTCMKVKDHVLAVIDEPRL